VFSKKPDPLNRLANEMEELVGLERSRLLVETARLEVEKEILEVLKNKNAVRLAFTLGKPVNQK
jgi:hypothetical protein